MYHPHEFYGFTKTGNKQFIISGVILIFIFYRKLQAVNKNIVLRQIYNESQAAVNDIQQ